MGLLPHFTQKPVWKPADALHMRNCLAAWFLTPGGRRESFEYAEEEFGIYRQAVDSGGMGDEELKLALFGEDGGARNRSDFWRSVDPIWVDESFANMALAAAESTPENQGIIPEDLIAPHGAIFFEQMIDGDLIPGFISGNSRIRAITWQTHTDKSGSPVAVAVSNWYEAQGSRYLWKHYTHILGFNASVTDMHSEGSRGGIFHLLRAVGAVARTSYAIDDQVEVQLSGSPKSKKGGRKPQPRRPQKIRRLYLRHPEYGAAELDAARGRQNRRLHWVRGHWRKQWYPSQEIHHIRWIEGHPRGSAELGTVEGERVLIGKGDGVLART